MFFWFCLGFALTLQFLGAAQIMTAQVVTCVHSHRHFVHRSCTTSTPDAKQAQIRLQFSSSRAPRPAALPIRPYTAPPCAAPAAPAPAASAAPRRRASHVMLPSRRSSAQPGARVMAWYQQSLVPCLGEWMRARESCHGK